MIEKARELHLDSVMAIWLNTNIAAHPFIPQSFWEGVFEQVKEAMPASDIFVYLENNQVLGFIGITDSGYIAGLFVDGKAQSQGISRKLLSHCKQLYPRLELDVFTENPGAVRFYQNNGFEITGTKISPDFNREEHHMVWSA
ncbi:GNAT family N-acetyltransferase [Desulfosarcina sp. OttesenSCG-928-B08]|nr:GNAT family N-acetyltransferase [Desulfosarcina sp. OttesenSCG-928-B08]